MAEGKIPNNDDTVGKALPNNNTTKLKQINHILKEISATSEPVDCIALYDVIQSAQTLYTANCPGP